MKTLQSIQEWIKSNPSEDEMKRVLKVINSGKVTQTRREVYQKERSLRKLVAIEKRLKEIGMPIPSEIQANIKSLKGNIMDLRKSLPEVKKRVKKVE